MPHSMGGFGSLILLVSAVGIFGQARSPEFWTSADGTKVNPLTNKRPAVLLFMLTDCPIANMYAPEISRIERAYQAKGIAFTLVYVDSNLSAKSAKKHLADYGLLFPAVLDPTHSLAKRVGATVSPEAVVLDSNGRMVYRGRIDDRAVAHGKIRPEPKRRDLRLTLDSLLKGDELVPTRTKAVGCPFRVESKQPNLGSGLLPPSFPTPTVQR